MEISYKGVDTQGLLVLLFAWVLGGMLGGMLGDWLFTSKENLAANTAEPPAAKADPKLFAQINEARREAIELEGTYVSVRNGDYSSAMKRAEDAFGGVEWRLSEDAKDPSGITQKDALQALQKYKDVVTLRREAIRDQLCDQVIVFVGADGRAAKGSSVTSVVTRYPKREDVTSPLAAEYCDASADEATSQVEVR